MEAGELHHSTGHGSRKRGLRGRPGATGVGCRLLGYSPQAVEAAGELHHSTGHGSGLRGLRGRPGVGCRLLGYSPQDVAAAVELHHIITGHG